MKALIIGANGQIGGELAQALAAQHGVDAVVTSDLSPIGRSPALKHEALDCTDLAALISVVERNRITQIYHLAAALSARGEQHPMWAWDLNMKGLLNVLEVARTHKLARVFWPSSIAAFGPSTPADLTPQKTVMDPTTVYGISKLAGGLVRLVPPPSRRGCAQLALPWFDQLENTTRWRHHGLCGGDLSRRAQRRALHLLLKR